MFLWVGPDFFCIAHTHEDTPELNTKACTGHIKCYVRIVNLATHLLLRTRGKKKNLTHCLSHSWWWRQRGQPSHFFSHLCWELHLCRTDRALCDKMQKWRASEQEFGWVALKFQLRLAQFAASLISRWMRLNMTIDFSLCYLVTITRTICIRASQN